MFPKCQFELSFFHFDILVKGVGTHESTDGGGEPSQSQVRRHHHSWGVSTQHLQREKLALEWENTHTYKEGIHLWIWNWEASPNHLNILKKVAFQSKIAFHISTYLKSLFAWQNSIWQKLKCLKSGWERDKGVPFFVFLNLKMCTGEWLKGKRWRTRKSCCNYCSTLLTAMLWFWSMIDDDLVPSCFLCRFSSFLIPFSFDRWYRWRPISRPLLSIIHCSFSFLRWCVCTQMSPRHHHMHCYYDALFSWSEFHDDGRNQRYNSHVGWPIFEQTWEVMVGTDDPMMQNSVGSNGSTPPLHCHPDEEGRLSGCPPTPKF